MEVKKKVKLEKNSEFVGSAFFAPLQQLLLDCLILWTSVFLSNSESRVIENQYQAGA